MGGLAVGGVMLQEVLPVAETHTAGQQGECCRVGGAVALHVAPDALEGGHPQGLLAALLDHAGEELEVGGSLHLARHGLLHHFAKLQDFGFVGLHIGFFRCAKL